MDHLRQTKPAAPTSAQRTRLFLKTVSLTTIAAIAMGSACLATAGSSRAAASKDHLVNVLGIMPPDVDYEAVCQAGSSARTPLITDWTLWDGTDTDRTTEDLFKIAKEYGKGSDRVFANPDVAYKILDYIEARRHDYEVAKLRLAQAETVLFSQKDAFDHEALDSLQRAIDAGSVKAATLMARYVGPEAPTARQNPDEAARLYAAAARAGNLEAEQGLLALANVENSGVTMDAEEKRYRMTNVLNRMISEILDNGTCSYLSQIGNLYLLEKYIHKQNDVALAWLTVQARLGDGVLAELLGRRLKLGRFFAYDLEKSIQLFKIAADKGRPRGMLEVGQAHIKSLIDNPSEQVGEDYLLRASEAGVPKAFEVLAKYYRGNYGHRFQPELAARYYELAARKSEKKEEMLFGLGKLLMLDTPVRDPAGALRAFEAAADLGHDGAAREAANLYVQGIIPGQEVDYVKAIRLYRFAAISGDSAAARSLSKLYRCGAGLPFRRDVSAIWLDRAAFLGSSESMYELAQQMLSAGMADGREIFGARGVMLLRRAAHEGSAKAIAALAHAYETGSDFIERDAERYQQLVGYSLGQDFNHDKIFRELASRRFKDGMTAEDRQEVIEKTAAEWGVTDLDPAFKETFATKGSTVNEASEQFNLANNLLDETTVPAATMKALGLLEDAAEDGYVKAKIDLVRFSETGYTVEALDRVGDEGVCGVRDALALATAYAEIGTEEAEIRKGTWVDRAVEVAVNDPVAAFDIGKAYWTGAFGASEQAKAETFLVKSLELGNERSLFYLAEGHIKDIWQDASVETGAKTLRDLAATGNAEAAYALLRFISQSKVGSDFEEVKQLLDLVSADRTLDADVGSLFIKLAALANSGKLGEPDAAVTLTWLQEAAENSGDPALFRRIADIHLNGQLGMPRDLQQGMQWMLKAAEAGDKLAAQRIARSYEFGFVFEKNASLAAEWDQKARILQ